MKRGFTLLELMMASAILLLVICGLLFTFINCLLLNESNRELVTAANDAQYVLERVKSLAYSEVVNNLAAAVYLPAELNLLDEQILPPTVATVSSRVKEVTVNVTWTGKRGARVGVVGDRSFSLSTRIVSQ